MTGHGETKGVPCGSCGATFQISKYQSAKFNRYCETCRPVTAFEIGEALELSKSQAKRLLRLAGIAPIDSYAGKYGTVLLYKPAAVAELRNRMGAEIEKARARRASAQKAVATKVARLL